MISNRNSYRQQSRQSEIRVDPKRIIINLSSLLYHNMQQIQFNNILSNSKQKGGKTQFQAKKD